MSKIISYKDTEDLKLEVTLRNDTIWLSLNQISNLFDRDKSVISRHLRNIFKTEELLENSVVAKYATTAADGKIYNVAYYNLDAILSVGYRVNSKQGTEFRIWATSILKDFLNQGDIKKLKKQLVESDQKLTEFKKLIQIQNQVVSKYQLENDETKGLIQVIANYATALELLDDYDHQRLQLPKDGSSVLVKIEYDEAKKAIAELGRQTQFQGLFGKEKDDSFKGSLANIYQTFDGIDLYTTTEEKAANLLYFVIKNHSFTDGNKRIAAFIFVWFLERNHLLYAKNGEKRVADTTLVALTLMIAQSHPNDKDIMVKVVVNLLA
ncbi:virulence protein RhuM/Fic/DOC family protein [Cellulophaga sp. Z1A5H]|uniref:virulence protein RhuM/Fic/DOC family protein n=1 Tax=Cellulophaga sp. Z1A5H TaxID=2687291 RepID=UPI0013FDAAD5|nr:virulence protein RhuM/Fic/DOC family protein [Cellulophaga sp. Z1A5H]